MRLRRNQVGMTLLEMVVATAGMTIIVGGALMFIIFQVKSQSRSFKESSIQESGRTALNVMSKEIGKAGLGLPRRLAFPSFGQEACGSVNTPFVEVASMDYLHMWTVNAAANFGAGAAVTLLDPNPVPATSADVAIPTGQWMFIFHNARIGDTGTGDHGYGALQVGSDRAVGAAAIAFSSRNYSATQPTIDMDDDNFDDDSAFILKLNVSRFGVDCSDVNRPFLYWDLNTNDRVPIASVIELSQLTSADPGLDAAAGARIGLRFRVLVDEDNDGAADDQNGDTEIDNDDLKSVIATLENAVAIEVVARLRSDTVDQDTGAYRYSIVRQLIYTRNLSTKSEDTAYVFIGNSALGI